MDIVAPETIAYLRKVANVKDPLIADMKSFAIDKKLPTIGTLGGQLCSQVALMTGAKEIFELGSRFGYSLVWIGRAVGPEARLHYTQSDDIIAAAARGFFERAGLTDQVVHHTKDPLEALKEHNGGLDMILLNLPKSRFADAMPVIRERLRKGGVLITVNTLMNGRVFRQTDDADAQAAQIFNHALARDPGFLTTINPIRSGITVSLKLI